MSSIRPAISMALANFASAPSIPASSILQPWERRARWHGCAHRRQGAKLSPTQCHVR